MSTITYKCPSCAGRLEFDSSLQTMKCPYCDSVYDVSELERIDDVLDALPPNPSQRVDWVMPSQSWTEDEQEGMFVYTCSTCAGAIVSDETLGTTSCPYCGNPVVITERFSGYLKPDLVLPFYLTKNDAKEALLRHYKGKPFLPKNFTDLNRIDEIKGVYAPFWLFDSVVDADAVYNCTRVRNYSDNKYRYTETRYYTVNRAGTIEFVHVPVDGSFRLADDLMESIEPFDYTQLVPFQTAYLAGYSANIYDVSADFALLRAQERMRSTAEDVVSSSINGYSTVSKQEIKFAFLNAHCYYALLPVWMLSSTHEGKVYSFAMNGQTGRLVGDLPVDKSVMLASFAKIAAIILALVLVASFALGWMGG